MQADLFWSYRSLYAAAGQIAPSPPPRIELKE